MDGDLQGRASLQGSTTIQSGGPVMSGGWPPSPPDLATLAKLNDEARPRLSQSAHVGALMAALAKAQAQMTSPRRNRTVTVKSRKTQTTYTFRYATLDVICDMIREPLAEAGIAVTHQHTEIEKRPGILTRIWCGEQYLGSWMPLVLSKEEIGMQDVGSASSYCMRYNLRELLNIASEEDDDGNSAAGNDYVYRDVDAPAGAAAGMTDEQKLLFAHERMLKASESVRLDDRAAGVQLLKLWQDRMERFETLRESKPEHWSKLLDRVSAALGRAFGVQYGKDFAWAWQAIADVTSAQQRDAAHEIFKAKHQAGVLELKKQTPQAYGLLMDHIRFFSGKVDQLEAIRVQKEQEAKELAAEIEAVEARAKQRAVPTDPEPRGFLVQPPKQLPRPATAPAPEAAETLYYVIDHTGDICSDGISDPLKFAMAYVAQWRATLKGDRHQLNENNTEALEWAGRSRMARATLDDAFSDLEPGEPANAPEALLDGDDIPNWDDKPLRVAAPVEQPRTRNGSLDCLRYLQAVQDSLAAVCDQPAMVAWLAANEPVYGAEGFPVGTRMKILTAVMARKRALGMQSDR